MHGPQTVEVVYRGRTFVHHYDEHGILEKIVALPVTPAPVVAAEPETARAPLTGRMKSAFEKRRADLLAAAKRRAEPKKAAGLPPRSAEAPAQRTPPPEVPRETALEPEVAPEHAPALEPRPESDLPAPLLAPPETPRQKFTVIEREDSPPAPREEAAPPPAPPIVESGPKPKYAPPASLVATVGERVDAALARERARPRYPPRVRALLEKGPPAFKPLKEEPWEKRLDATLTSKRRAQ